MSDADDAGVDAVENPDTPAGTAPAGGSNRWEQRSGWIAEPSDPAPSEPAVAPPATRPIRTRSRIVAAAVGETPDVVDLRRNTSELDPEPAVPVPPAIPPALPGSASAAAANDGLIDLRSDEVRSLLQEGTADSPGVALAGGAHDNVAVNSAQTGQSGAETDGSVRGPVTESTSKWGAARTVPAPATARSVEPGVTNPDSKYGPSLVTLSDATDPGLLLTPIAASEVAATPAEVGSVEASVSEGDLRAPEPPEPVAFPAAADTTVAAGQTPAALGGPTATGDRPKPGPRPADDPPSGFPAAAEAEAERSEPDLPAQIQTRSLVHDRKKLDERGADDGSGSRVFTSGLFLAALALAVAAGILGALWQRERTTNEELRSELAVASEFDAQEQQQLDQLGEANRTLELQNEQLERELAELRTLVAPVPEGRITAIDVPFVPSVVDEFRGRLIAVDSAGEYVIWGTGVEGGITDSGTVAGPPSSMFAHRDNAWIATEQGGIEVISLIDGSDVLAIATGEVSLIVPSSRTVWSFVPGSRELRRHRETNGNVRATVTLPVDIRELSSGAGAIWALGEDGLVYRVNTADLTVAPIPAGQEVVSIAAGTDALWALSAADGSLRRVDAVSGEVLVTVPVGRDPVAVEFAGSSVWVALRSGETLIEVDTRTAAVVSRTSLPGVPVEITAGSTGVLVTLEGDTPLVRVASNEDPEAVAEGADLDPVEGDQADG